MKKMDILSIYLSQFESDVTGSRHILTRYVHLPGLIFFSYTKVISINFSSSATGASGNIV